MAKQVLVAARRHLNTAPLRPENLDINLGNRGQILADDYMHAAANMWSTEDVSGDPLFETVAAR